MRTLACAALLWAGVCAAGLNLGMARPAPLRQVHGRFLPAYPLASLSPLKGLLIDLWWIQIQTLEADYEFDRIDEIAERISYLQPFLPKVWEFMAWNVGFNLSAEATGDPGKQAGYHRKALELLRAGLAYNPDSADLHFYKAWFLYKKSQGEPSFAAELAGDLGEPPLEVALRELRVADPIGHGDYYRSLFLLQLLLAMDMKEAAREAVPKVVERFPETRDELEPLLRRLEP